MISVPYGIELNDITMFVSKSLSGDDFYQSVVDQFDQLYKESAHSRSVMSLSLHPFVINTPFRHEYLEKALDYITSHEACGGRRATKLPPIISNIVCPNTARP